MMVDLSEFLNRVLHLYDLVFESSKRRLLFWDVLKEILFRLRLLGVKSWDETVFGVEHSGLGSGDVVGELD